MPDPVAFVCVILLQCALYSTSFGYLMHVYILFFLSSEQSIYMYKVFQLMTTYDTFIRMEPSCALGSFCISKTFQISVPIHSQYES